MRVTACCSSASGRRELRIPGISSSAQAWTSGDRTEGPSPQELLAASLASCTVATMEHYAARKGWEIGEVEVEVDYSPAERGCPTHCGVVVHLPEDLPREQRERLMQVGAKSQVHRTLEGEVVFDERVELTCPRGAERADTRNGKASRKPNLLLRGLWDHLRTARPE